jgi:non-ribosomal peptide synthetase component F
MKLADLLITVGPTSAPVDDSTPVLQSAPQQTVHELFRAQVRATPNAVAVGSPDAQLTYAQLDWQSDQLALKLLKCGVQSEEFILLLMNRSPRIVVAMLAVLKAGAAYVPILPTDPLERIQYIACDTRSRTLISELSLRGLGRAFEPARPGVPSASAARWRTGARRRASRQMKKEIPPRTMSAPIAIATAAPPESAPAPAEVVVVTTWDVVVVVGAAGVGAVGLRGLSGLVVAG